ncbi:MAG: glycosyltransferase family 39 protein [Acidobacteriota bacterium]
MPNRKIWASTLRWTLVCWVVVFWRMDYRSLIDDEAHYAQLTREMLRTGSWLVPTLNGAPFIDKPILFHWLQALAFSVFGESEFSAGLPSALAAVVLFVITAVLGKRLMSGGVAERAWLMLATMPATFVLSRIGYLDMLFTMCLFGSIACVLLSALHGRRRLQYLGYALLVLAIMTKGPVALALVGLFFMLAWLVGGECRQALRTVDWRVGLALTVLGSAPWFVWMHGRFGDRFIQDYLLEGHLHYLSPRASGSSSASGFYLEMFVTVFFPWSLVALGSLIDDLRRWWKGTRPPSATLMLWLWIVSVLLLFTVARFRVDRYIFPAAPACCLLAARGWMMARQEHDARSVAFTRAAIFAVAVLLIGAGVVLGLRLPTLGLDVPLAAFSLPVILLAGGLWIAWQMVRGHLRPPPVLNGPIGVLVTVYALVVAIGFPILEKGRPIKAVGSWLQAQSTRGDAVGLYALDRWQPTLRYYGRRPLERLDDEDAVRKFLAEPGPRWLVTRRDSLRALAPDVTGAAPPDIALTVPAIVGTSGRGVRRQIWSDVIVVRKTAEPTVREASGPPVSATDPLPTLAASSTPSIGTVLPVTQLPPPTSGVAVAASRPDDRENIPPPAPPESASMPPRSQVRSDVSLAQTDRRTSATARPPRRRVRRGAGAPPPHVDQTLQPPLLQQQK